MWVDLQEMFLNMHTKPQLNQRKKVKSRKISCLRLDDEDLIEPEVLANRWKMALNTLAKWRVSGKGPPFSKIGRHVFYRFHDVKDFEVKISQGNTSFIIDYYSERDLKKYNLKRCDFKKGSPRLEIAYNKIKEENKRRAK